MHSDCEVTFSQNVEKREKHGIVLLPIHFMKKNKNLNSFENFIKTIDTIYERSVNANVKTLSASFSPCKSK